jgi:hypothetical protein
MLLTAYAHYKNHINVNPLLCTVTDAHVHCYGGDRKVQCDTDRKLIVWRHPTGDIYIYIFFKYLHALTQQTLVGYSQSREVIDSNDKYINSGLLEVNL